METTTIKLLGSQVAVYTAGLDGAAVGAINGFAVGVYVRRQRCTDGAVDLFSSAVDEDSISIDGSSSTFFDEQLLMCNSDFN